MNTAARSRTVLAGFMAALLALSSGCVSSYDQQPATAYYVAPPPTQPVAAPAAPAATEASLAANAPGQEITVGTDYADTDPSALQDFKEPLAPYGTWINDPTYGTVWVPREDVVGADFVPYQTAGHWVYDDDYVWVSDYSWGWAPFHYGRWVSMQGRGWAWIPGRTYAGAWVVWRTGPAGYGYVGWAPMAPSWYWFDGYAYGLSVALWYQPHYAYCHHDYLFSRNVTHHVVRGRDAQVHDARTTTYTPARPAVDGRTAAKPTVDDRTAAKPTVDPAPGKPPGDNAFSRGPDPKSIGVDSGRIARVSPEDHGIAKAREFASPQSAVKAGGSPPSGSASLGKERSASTSVVTSTVGRPALMDPPVAMAVPYHFAKPAPPAPNQGIAAASAVRSQPSAPVAAQSPTALAPRSFSADSRTAIAPAPTAPRLSAPSAPSPSEFAARAGQVRAAPSYVAPSQPLSTPSSSTFARSGSPSLSAPSRSSAPTYSPSSRSPSSFSAPSRSSSPTFSAASRSPSYASPSRSVSPSRPSVSAPSRSFSAPSRSVSPSRSFSAPSRSSSPSRSFSSPSRSSGGGRSFSPSRGRR